MGSCVSVDKHPESAASLSLKKLRLGFGSKTDKLVTPSPPPPVKVKDKDNPMLSDHLLKSHPSPPRPLLIASRDFGSKEETFFDSHPWLESDCEDDFFSVNGDFTPSRGNTPVHYSFSGGSPQTNRQLFAERTSNLTSEQSMPDKKKRLSELFRDTVGGDEDEKLGSTRESDTKISAPEVSPKAGKNSPYVSAGAGNSERSPNGDLHLPREKSGKSRAQCCLPRLRSLSERKKRSSAAVVVLGDK